MRDQIKMYRTVFVTQHAISKMANPHVQVFGMVDGVNFDIYIYKSKRSGSRWTFKLHENSWGFVLTILNDLVRFGIPRENFSFYGTVFETGRLSKEPEQFLSSIKTEEEK